MVKRPIKSVIKDSNRIINLLPDLSKNKTIVIPFDGKEMEFVPGTRTILKVNKRTQENSLIDCIMDLAK